MKVVFWSVFVAGFIACATVGIGPALKRAAGSWTSPAMLVGTAAGVAILALAVAFATGTRGGVLASDGAMVLALVILIGLKVATGFVQAGAVALHRG